MTDNQAELRLLAKGFNDFIGRLFYADSNAKNQDHSCTIQWTERTLATVSVPAARLPIVNLPIQKTIEACW